MPEGVHQSRRAIFGKLKTCRGLLQLQCTFQPLLSFVRSFVQEPGPHLSLLSFSPSPRLRSTDSSDKEQRRVNVHQLSLLLGRERAAWAMMRGLLEEVASNYAGEEAVEV
jgi:hypothetical protein